MPAEGRPPPGPSPWVLVVEDEARLRDELQALLAALAPDLGPTRPAGSAEEAAALCGEAPPHIAFIDIRLPGRSGLAFAQDLPAATRVVFVTAHEDHAVQAFDHGAVDYLLKPISRERLQRCVDRLRARAPGPASDRPADPAVRPKPSPPPPLRWLAASSGRRTRLIAVEDVIYLQSDNRYTRVVCREGEHLIEEPIKTLLPRLDPTEFRQVHRSTVVNLREVLMVERDETGGGTLHLRQSPDVLRISAPYLREFKAFLE